MRKLKYFLLILSSCALAFYFYCWRLPNASPVPPPDLPMNDRILLLPLDSRPVCSSMAQKLGALAAIDVTVPPKALLDNYRQPADTQKLFPWLNTSIPQYPYAIISADLLLHGGLLSSRQQAADAQTQAQTLTWLRQILRQYENRVTVFSVIPRLLVSDELLPDRWYQFHLMCYSKLLDMTEINADPYFTSQLLDYQTRIPPEILRKYLELYAQSQNFNNALLNEIPEQSGSASGAEPPAVVIGQDDASPLGLPRRCAALLADTVERCGLQTQAQLTCGADDIAVLLLARYYLRQNGWQPKIYLQYASPEAEFKYMPYMAVSVGTALRSQLQLIGARPAASPQDADIICYINCGDDDSRPGQRQTAEMQELLREGRHTALIDLSANFEAEELLLPRLLADGVQLNRLAAYAGWNTFSNSSGTALAQAVIFAGRLRQLREEGTSEDSIAALYAANLRFTAERMLEDYFYQKLLHPQLRPYLESCGVTPTSLSEQDKLLTEGWIQKRLSWYAWLLLHRNLGREPFYRTEKADYYLRDLTVGARLPWARIFEVDLIVSAPTGRIRKS